MSVSSAFTKSARMEGKVCVVTGAGSGQGIGWATVTKFAQEGARHIYALDINTETMPSLTASLQDRFPGVKITAVTADVTDEDAMKAVCARAIDEHGRLDVFFANAGGTMSGFNTLVQDMSVDCFMGTMKLNTLSCFLAAKYATLAMTSANPEAGKNVGGGSIVFTASIAGMRSSEGSAEYGASKAAVISLAQTVAQENLALRNGVRVNAVCPGAVETALTSGYFDVVPPASRMSSIRIGTPAEIANMVSFLACDESSYCTGQHFVVDGGLIGPIPVDRVRPGGT